MGDVASVHAVPGPCLGQVECQPGPDVRSPGLGSKRGLDEAVEVCDTGDTGMALE